MYLAHSLVILSPKYARNHVFDVSQAARIGEKSEFKAYGHATNIERFLGHA